VSAARIAGVLPRGHVSIVFLKLHVARAAIATSLHSFCRESTWMCGTRTFSARGRIRPQTLAEIFEHCQDQSVIAYNSSNRGGLLEFARVLERASSRVAGIV